MPRRKSPTVDQTAVHAPENSQPASENAASPAPQAAEAGTPEAPSQAPLRQQAANGHQASENAASPASRTPAAVQAPAKGEGRSYTIDNRLGYRKEDSADGRKRQIRFADRPDGQRPDDEILAPVREQKPEVGWAAREKAWQARKTPEGLEALDSADQKLAEIGRKRTGGPER